jgi:cytidylate kinase
MMIVIDGPAGSGKSSTARAVADKLQIEYLDSGALYRTVTLLYLQADGDEALFFELLNQAEILFSYYDQQFHVKVDGSPVTEQLRSPKVAAKVSKVAAMPRVRAFVNNLMRTIIVDGIYIAEGRDLGTAVFPDAELKFFMKAELEERARRRFEDQKSDNSNLTFEEVKENIMQRDRQDSNRKTDPLRKADDAIDIDTTNLDFEQQVDKICSYISDQMED